MAQCWYRGVGHRKWAAVAGLYLGPEVKACGTNEVSCTCHIRCPRSGMQPVCDRTTHEPVPGWVELDLIDAITVAIMGMQ